MSTRVYLPLTTDDLRSLRDARHLTLDGRIGSAVTAVVREAYPDEDEEDLEYAALWDAAECCRPGPVVVAAADLPAGAAHDSGRDGDEAYRVGLRGDLDVPLLVALHVEEPGAGPDDELSWYDATELDDVAGRLAD